MTPAGDLFTCLLEVDRTLGCGDLRAARTLLEEARHGALQLQQEILAAVREKEALKRSPQEATCAPPAKPRSAKLIFMPVRASMIAGGVERK